MRSSRGTASGRFGNSVVAVDALGYPRRVTADPDVKAPDEDAWGQAVNRLFAALGEVSPTYDLRAVQYELRGAGLVIGADDEPPLTAHALAAGVDAALARGPHVAVAPWERAKPGERPEVDWIRHVTTWGGHHLGVVVPASSLSGSRVKALWQVLPDGIGPLAVMTGTRWFPLIHSQFETALVVLGPQGDGLLRMFRIPEQLPGDQWLADLDQLCRQQGGRTQFGYVLRQSVPVGAPLNFEHHDPAALARAADLSNFGETRELAELFDVLRSPGAVRVGDRSRRTEGQIALVAGRDIGRDGTLASELDRAERSEGRPVLQLREGDVVVGGVVARTDTSGYRCAVVRSEHLPAVAGGSVVVLRPREAIDPGVLEFLLDYLRSPVARQVFATSARKGGPHLLPADLRAMRVPIPDPALAAALTDLSAAAATLASWQEEATTLLRGLFQNPSASAARRQVIRGGRHIRMRAELGSRLDDFNQTVRAQYPFPIAYRWRSLDALRSGPDLDATYRAALDTYEVLLCYLAQIALTMARIAGVDLGELAKIKTKLEGGRHGLGLGDWSAILDEVAGHQIAALPDETPLGDVRRFLPPGGEASAARIRLTRRRNDQAHLQPVASHELPDAVESALADLTLLMRQADFLVDLPLIHVASSRWDNLARRATLRTQHLMGDHPVVPFHTEETDRNDLEAGSLYMGDAAGELHLLRPLLIGRECPACQTWSTFHVDLATKDGIRLKSLEHGHTVVDSEVRDALASIGLL